MSYYEDDRSSDVHVECVSGIYSIELVNDNLYEWNIKLYK